MKIKNLEERISLLELVKRDYEVKQISKNEYRVNPCPVCKHNDHFTIYADTNSYSSFSDCCEGGSVYKYLQEVKGLSEKEAYEELKRLANYEQSLEQKTKQEVIKVNGADYTEQINKQYNKQTEEQKQYFKNRGLSEDIIEKYKLCVNGDYAIVPFWNKDKVIYYIQRAINDTQPKYKNLQGLPVPIWNEHYLDLELEEPIIACEGIFDALSIEDLGFKAISLNSANNTNKLLSKLDKKQIFLLTAFDNDEAGRNATSEVLQRIANARQIPIPSKFKDINEWYTADKKGISQVINKVIKHLTKPDVVSIYLEEFFKEDILSNKKAYLKKTGFKNLDKNLQGLYNGLYVLGGATSLGKTTFAHQIADQLAEQGEDVIYFTLEQSKFELVSKSLSRLTAKKDINNATTSLQIRSGYQSDSKERLALLMNAVREYKQPSEHISIIEGNYNLTIEGIRKYIDTYIKANKVKPFVFIDYLQVLQTSKPYLATDKQRIDYIITELKRISRDFDITLFVISSINRSGYSKPIDLEAPKESGGIEYTADVVLGLQLDVKEFKADVINKAKNSDPRPIKLVCLKNRYGACFECLFDYKPKFDLFEESKKPLF
jgi:replicative DNA helicase